MTPKEKAKELFEKMYYKIQPDELGKDQESAKQCALIAVNLVISSNPHSNPFNTAIHSTIKYWGEVKQEIEKL